MRELTTLKGFATCNIPYLSDATLLSYSPLISLSMTSGLGKPKNMSYVPFRLPPAKLRVGKITAALGHPKGKLAKQAMEFQRQYELERQIKLCYWGSPRFWCCVPYTLGGAVFGLPEKPSHCGSPGTILDAYSARSWGTLLGSNVFPRFPLPSWPAKEVAHFLAVLTNLFLETLGAWFSPERVVTRRLRPG